MSAMDNHENSLFSRISNSFGRQTFLSLIDAKLESVARGRVEVSCESSRDLLQQHGLLHAGVTTTLADVACGYAALTCMPEGAEVLSVEFKVNFMRPATAKKIVAVGQVLKAGKTLVVAEATVTGEDGTLIAKMMSTMITIKGNE